MSGQVLRSSLAFAAARVSGRHAAPRTDKKCDRTVLDLLQQQQNQREAAE
jgi:hypothetical protein